ncbi:MAG: sodium/solute symporter [Candidatus Thermoplasmatota archaeon]|nr:sodium/solute symporter [Candidatus Thermoplasmatota archaeon]MCK5300439.1 sodium/solute symporter [Thermoplasmatales archaeon]
MDVLFFAIFMALFAGVFAFLGYLGYKKTKTAEDYYVAGRKMGPIVIAFSYGATFISAVALIGFSGISSVYGHSLLWLAFLNIFVGILIAFIFYGFRTRKMGLSLKALTLPELLGNRFNSTKLQATSGLIIAVFMVFYTTAVFLAIATLFEVTFGIPYWICVIVFTIVVGLYLIVGGLYAVMWTHAIQGILMLIGMVILTIGIYMMLGGIGPAHEAASMLTQEDLTSMGWTSIPSGFTTLTSFPELFSPAYMLLLTLIFGVGIGVLAQPQLIVRYLSAKSEKALRRAIPYGGIFILLMTFTAFSIGPLSNVLMINNGLSYPGTPDKVVPLIVNELFPEWFVVLFLFAVLSAAMSTASALFHTAGASIGRDVFEKSLMKKCSEKKSLLITRIATLGIVFATLIISLNPPDVVAILTSFFFGLMACTFLAPYTLMLYWKKISRFGAWFGMLGGFIFTMGWYVLIYFKTAPELIGRSLTENYLINMLDPIFIGLPLSFILTIIFSFLIKQDNEEIKSMNLAFENI